MKVRTRKLAVFVTCLGVAAAFPVLSSADRGGTPPQPGQGCKKIHKAKKKPHPNNKGAGKGRKCGWNGTTTGVTSVATPTGSTSTETETNTTTSTTVSTVSSP